MDHKVQRVALLLNQGLSQQAERLAREYLSSDIENPDLLYLLALALYDQDRHAQALPVISRVIAGDPEWAEAHVLLARIHYSRHHFKEANQAIEEAIQLDPYNSDAFYLKSITAGRYNRWSEALTAAENGLTLNPECPNCGIARAEALAHLKRKGEAFETLYKTLSQHPENEHTHNHLGWLKLQHGKHKEAREHFREALRRDPGCPSSKAGLKEALKARNPLRSTAHRYLMFESMPVKATRLLLLAAALVTLILILAAFEYYGLAKGLTIISFLLIAYLMYGD